MDVRTDAIDAIGRTPLIRLRRASDGINVAAAIRLARELGPGRTIVTVLADSGQRYASRLFNPDFLRSKNLSVPDWLEG